MDVAQYLQFIPGSDSVLRLISWVRSYVGDEFRWELQLMLRAGEVPGICLGRTGQLGWSTWLGGKEFEEDANGLVLRFSHV